MMMLMSANNVFICVFDCLFSYMLLPNRRVGNYLISVRLKEKSFIICRFYYSGKRFFCFRQVGKVRDTYTPEVCCAFLSVVEHLVASSR